MADAPTAGANGVGTATPPFDATGATAANPAAVNQQPVVDANNDGIPDHLQNFLQTSDFKVDFSNRRRTLWIVLCVLGVILSFVSAVLLTLLFLKNGNDFERVLNVVETLLWLTFGSSTSLIGTYIFGAAYEAGSYRKGIVDIVKIKSNAAIGSSTAATG